jgi:hypothetical protein
MLKNHVRGEKASSQKKKNTWAFFLKRTYRRKFEMDVTQNKFML